MKKVLITGVNSYVGNSFANWVQPDFEVEIEKISLRDGTWREKNFSKFDVVLHVAGLAHVSTDSKQEDLYYKVNRDLTIEFAEKVKKDGVKQFIFLSSIIVYGDKIEDGIIRKNTVPKPVNFYGKSKLQAEEGILPFQSNLFNVVIIRPPMIYGKNSKGNYSKLSKLAKLSPVFPNINNQRSMLHIDNLSEFIKLLIVNEEKGYFFPQNQEYVKTSEMVRMIREVHGKKTALVKIINFVIKPLIPRLNIANKVFGNLIYDNVLSEYKVNYRKRDFRDSIIFTEKI